MQGGADLGSGAINLYNEILWNARWQTTASFTAHLCFYCAIYYQGFILYLLDYFTTLELIFIEGTPLELQKWNNGGHRGACKCGITWTSGLH